MNPFGGSENEPPASWICGAWLRGVRANRRASFQVAGASAGLAARRLNRRKLSRFSKSFFPMPRNSGPIPAIADTRFGSLDQRAQGNDLHFCAIAVAGEQTGSADRMR